MAESPAINWKQQFKDLCEQMKRDSLEHLLLGDRGTIDFRADDTCQECSSVGVYSGDEMEQGCLYEIAMGAYCSSCKNLSKVFEHVNFAPYSQTRFLPILKGKIIEQPALVEGLTKSRPCKQCHGDTYTFSKDLGATDYYDNEWTVCINKECTWPGYHCEQYSCAF